MARKRRPEGHAIPIYLPGAIYYGDVGVISKAIGTTYLL
jgi:hypothetical protein